MNTTPDKKLTPMGTLYTALHNTHPSQWNDILMNDKSALLEAEREMVEMSFTDGDMNRTYVDPADYFTQNYRQQ